MRKHLIILLPLILASCTTPETVLKNDQTEQVTRCGGNVAYAGILYPFMVSADNKCVKDYENQGFQKTESTK
jgi:hypothetical protein